MFRKTLLATATAGVIASLAATAAPASAATSLYLSTPSVHLGITAPMLYAMPYPQARWVCTPEFRQVPYWYNGRLMFRLVKVDEDCRWQQPQELRRELPRMPMFMPFWPFGW